MAINSSEQVSEKTIPTSTTKSLCSQASNLSSCRLMKIDYKAEDSITSSTNKHEDSKKSKNTSPYLTEDRIQLLSRVTEKKLFQKKTTDFFSSFPLAVNIYKASSGEIKSSKNKKKKVKKSVLTLPNEQAPLPQACTVSDMNDSEYLNESRDERKPKPKKRRYIQSGVRPRLKSKGMEVFDRDVRYCTQLNIDLDSSSIDTINEFTGDGKKVSRKRQNNLSNNTSLKAHDVWAMLRNMNRFPFRPSPPGSQETIASIKKRKNHNRHRNSQMDTKFIETCRTEEFTYISSLVDKTPHNSQSSLDRITVIDKQDEYQGICEEVKLVQNKISTQGKSQKNVKTLTKNKSSTQAKQRKIRITHDEGLNDKILKKKDENQELGSNLCNNSQNKDKVVNSMLVNVSSNHQNLECTHQCHCQNNFNVSKSYNTDFNNNEDIRYANSDSSNGDIIKNLSDVTDAYEDQNKLDKLSPSESQWQINGITQVVLSKGQNIFTTKKADTLKRKPRLVTTMPRAAVMPKLTQTEIKRRLARIKFPFIILTKDEVCPAVKITDYEPPQFAGLDEQVWPFMQKWIKNDHKKECTNYIEEKNCVSDKPIQGTNSGCVVKSKDYIKNTKNVINGNNNLNSKNKNKSSLLLKDKNAMQLGQKVENANLRVTKSKPMRQFKDRMFQFLYKNPPIIVNDDTNKCFKQEATKHKDVPSNLVDVSTNTTFGLVFPTEYDEILCRKEGKQISYTPSKHLWARGRWASDFIDNVIKKIRTGVYYNNDVKMLPRNSTKDDSVQTDIIFANYECCQNCNGKPCPMQECSKRSDLLQSIPGFEDSLSDLRIESINQNQVAIKHCITNIIVQFDVVLPCEISRMLQLKQSFSCIPIKVTESQTKIFKSGKTIVNAILPAELCSILPSMMQKIIDSRLVLPKIVDKVESHLSTIAELIQCDSNDSIKNLIKKYIPVHIHRTPVFQNLREGKFSDHILAITCKTSTEKKHLYHHKEFYPLIINELMPNMNRNLILDCRVNPTALHIFNLQSKKWTRENNTIRNNTSTCMKIQPYRLSNKQVVSAITKFDFNDITQWILNIKNFTVNLSVPLINTFSDLYCKDKVTISMAVTHDQNIVRCGISNVKVDALCNGFQERYKDCKKLQNILNFTLIKQKSNAIDKYNPSKLNKIENCKGGFEYCVNNSKKKKSSFIKLYKKCKSMSSIPNERSNFALSKINTLDDFFATLGSAKTLARVCDGATERKILISIKEMKNWMTDITPRQALLVLLLSNKKDTSNLVRYRPVILQGIAVNRITRASELDMEIEVIERENMNTFSQYEGISYLPASVENQDTLLEELYWIAKTTASDYQRTFDESSERLLKSLLEKRKKLNPSYLRVMARYVGLGLLK